MFKTENSQYESDTCKMLNLFKQLMLPHLPRKCTYCGGPHLYLWSLWFPHTNL